MPDFLDSFYPITGDVIMAARATIADVARKAGVSVATVDRVLNGRRRVKPSTAEAVRCAAEEIGFYAASLLARRARELVPERRLGFVLQKQTKSFYCRLKEDISVQAAALRDCNAMCRTRFVNELAPAPIIETMRALENEGVDAIGAVALEHPHVNDEVARLKNAGIPVWALLSSVSSPDIAGYIGIDARKAGRSAAWGMARCARPGTVIGVLVGSHRYRSHEDREGGFRSYMRERRPDFRLLQSMSYLDDSDGAYESVAELAAKHPDLGGIYLIGGGSAGAVQALRDESLDSTAALICHEKTPTTRDALIDGTVNMIIHVPTERIARAAVRALAGAGAPAGPLEFGILISENV